MKKNLLLTLSVSLFSVGSVAFADFKASGTEYSKALAAQEKWTEDMANEFVSMPNSFACIIANSGGEVNANANWTALIDEVACGLADADPQSKAVKYSKAAMKSSRANNNSAQEVTSWFNAQGGMRYVADVTLKQSAATLAPFGEWYFSFYNAGVQASNGTWTTYTKDDSGQYGFVDIGPSGNDVAILVSEEGYEDGAQNGQPLLNMHRNQYAKVIFVEGSSANTKFLGKNNQYATLKSNGSVQGGVASTYVAGATNATHYFRQNLDASGNASGTPVCFDRSSQFETVHDSGLYDLTTGKKVNITGGFGFTKADGTRGYLGNWGVWIDGGDTHFTTSTQSVKVTDDDGVEYTLKWAPGTLQQMSLTEETLADGDTFKNFWYETFDGSGNWQSGDFVTAVWSAAKSKFILNGENTTDVEVASVPYPVYTWSDTKRAQVIWQSGDKIKLQNRKNVTFLATFADATSTKFVSKETKNMRHTKASSLPYSLSAYNNSSDNQGLQFDGNTATARRTYHLTGSSPGGSYEPNTLYLDTGDEVLSTDDKPIRFDFSVNDREDTTTDYGNNNATADYSRSSDKDPYGEIDLLLASEAESADATSYRWEFSATPWQQSKAAYNASGARVVLDEPIIIDYTFATSDDRNLDGSGNALAITLVSNDQYNPLDGCTVSGGISTCSNVRASDYNGRKFVLEYDGGRVNGMPGLEVCTKDDCSGNSYYLQLVNLKDGTQLTDTKGNKYAFLGHAISSTFQEAAGAAAATCSAIAFTDLTSLGIAAGDVPTTIDRASTDYPLPSSAWTDAPTTSKCTVTMGDTSGC